MKITIEVYLENETFVSYLMNKICFTEIDRVSTGGMHSHPSLLMTFEGDKEKYHERGYIVKPAKSEWTNDTYFCIKYPNGGNFKTLDDFLKDFEEKFLFNYNEIP